MKLDDIALEVAQTITASGCITSSRDLTIFTRRLLTRLEQEGWRLVPKDAVTWLVKHKPGLCEKSGLLAAPRIEKE